MPGLASRAIAPTLDAERAFWQAGLLHVAGVDEVGRGALAGPLVAAAVVLPACSGPSLRRLGRQLAGVRDSKQLLPAARTELLPRIRDAASAVAVGVVEVEELDALGLAAANRLAMERAVACLALSPDVLLLDAVTVDLSLPQVGLIDGDARCLSIAAASIVAKVTRDEIMIACDDHDARYGFADHKGYGTPHHQRCLSLHGPSALHRRSFAPILRALQGHTG